MVVIIKAENRVNVEKQTFATIDLWNSDEVETLNRMQSLSKGFLIKKSFDKILEKLYSSQEMSKMSSSDYLLEIKLPL